MADNPVEGTGISSNDAVSAFSAALDPLRGGQPDGGDAPSEANQPRDEAPDDGPDETADEADATADDLDLDDAEQGQSDDGTPDDDVEDPDSDDPDDNADGDDIPDSWDGLAEALGVEAKDLAEHIQVQVTIDGETKMIPLSEATAGYQRLEVFKEKTAKVAEEARAVTEREQALDTRERQVTDQLVPLVQYMATGLKDDQARVESMMDPSSPNYDPESYHASKTALDQRLQAVQKALHHHEREQARQQKAAAEKREKDIAAENDKLLSIFPEWKKNPDKGRQQATALRTFAVEQYGIPEEFANSFYRADYFAILNDAKKWRDLQREKPGALKRARDAKGPKLKPGAKAPAKDKSRDRLRGNLKALRDSGGKDKNAAVDAFSTILDRKRGRA